MEIKEFAELLKCWGTKSDLINSSQCIDGCSDCELNQKILVGGELSTICTVICKISKELND